MLRRSGLVGLIALAGTLGLLGCSRAPRHDAMGRVVGQPVQLAPDPATALTPIVVVFADHTLRRERCRFEWHRNGVRLSVGATDQLEPGWFSRGDRIEVTVLVPDSGDGQERRLHAEVEVVNTPPTVLGVAVRPAVGPDRAELAAVPEATDADGDTLTYSYRWFRNGKPLESETGVAVAMQGLAAGDQVAVEVVASDGRGASAPARSEAVDIRNQPPSFTSSPAVPGPADSVYRYQVVATDADGDPLRYELTEGPPGMTLDADGMLTWRLPAGDRRTGEYTIVLRSVDTKGAAATQRFSLRIAPPSPRR